MIRMCLSGRGRYEISSRRVNSMVSAAIPSQDDEVRRTICAGEMSTRSDNEPDSAKVLSMTSSGLGVPDRKTSLRNVIIERGSQPLFGRTYFHVCAHRT